MEMVFLKGVKLQFRVALSLLNRVKIEQSRTDPAVIGYVCGFIRVKWRRIPV